MTVASQEPTLGFDLQPCIEFLVAVVTEAKCDLTEHNCTEEEVNMKLFDYMRVSMVVKTDY